MLPRVPYIDFSEQCFIRPSRLIIAHCLDKEQWLLPTGVQETRSWSDCGIHGFQEFLSRRNRQVHKGPKFLISGCAYTTTSISHGGAPGDVHDPLVRSYFEK